MTDDDEREVGDDTGLSDDVNAVIHPETARARTHIPATSLTVVATITASAEVIPAPETTSYGFPVTRTFTIKQGVNSGVHQYDLIENGEVVWHGAGTDPADGLIKAVIYITEPDADFPNN